MTEEQLRVLEKALKGTHKNLYDVCYELGIEVPDEDTIATLQYEQCSHCNIWSSVMYIDDDGFSICPVCQDLETYKF